MKFEAGDGRAPGTAPRGSSGETGVPGPEGPILVLGGTGKSGRRIVERLASRAPRDFAAYASDTAATGVWSLPAERSAGAGA